MAKRTLTRRQAFRQKKIQEERIKRAQKKTDALNTAAKSGELSPEKPGLLIAHFGVHLVIEDEQGNLHHCKKRQNLGAIVTGDKVIWRSYKNGDGVVVAVEERKSVLSRPTEKQAMRPIAANVDLIAIVVAPSPPPSATTIDRYLIIAEHLNIKPIIVVNKRELFSNNAHIELVKKLNIYQQLGYEWVESSTKTKHGLDNLQSLLKNKTSVLVGQSGVGKSSLLKCLIPDADIRVGELCRISKLGKHTTTVSRLYHLPFGGKLIDSPGIRRFGLWHLSENIVASGFIEFQPFLGKCKFRNCRHLKEPGCAIINARDHGLISPMRLNNFYELIQSEA